ncbi:MAG TPA: aminomethyl-transferring glycine dehydrogenase subunit GcvPA [Gammaproteobacteria bacterium]|nr:putative glycine dehydrogenase subunit 1 [bacterium BMS3Abin11]HDH16585.1 aminomethyl-transferring glycine dehydrogenase subunit GcvPA [Gammaproteobacteria bacterium]HDZ77716.1 aminomethyl-transferring glycine dehydrogenase subunit GcvPA [Gammaproteobacteria bacterium]
MPFIPHTKEETRRMLEAIGVKHIDELFNEIPDELINEKLNYVPSAMGEAAIRQLSKKRAASDGTYINFIGAGAYEHHIPAAVWQLATRGEFYSAYTPYQAEASQGTLQLLYEYQTMMASLTSMDVSNASLYEGASALAEAVLMVVRVQRKKQRILMPETVHPRYRETTGTIVKNQGIMLSSVAYSAENGCIDLNRLTDELSENVAAIVIPQPNYFGALEDVDELVDLAHKNGCLVIAVVNPLSLAVLKAPGDWGETGADIVVGEGQPLGVPLSSGGPYFGFMCCSRKLVRQMPGRLIGRTIDAEGKQGFTLTLQAREQHIRRSKATSNICTNQGLMVTAATLYMSLMGPAGMAQAAQASHANTRKLIEKLTAIDGVEIEFNSVFFHECVLRIDAPTDDLLRAMTAQGIIPGKALAADFNNLQSCLLVCATELRTEEEMDKYALHLERIVSKRRLDPPCAQKM